MVQMIADLRNRPCSLPARPTAKEVVGGGSATGLIPGRRPYRPVRECLLSAPVRRPIGHATGTSLAWLVSMSPHLGRTSIIAGAQRSAWSSPGLLPGRRPSAHILWPVVALECLSGRRRLRAHGLGCPSSCSMTARRTAFPAGPPGYSRSASLEVKSCPARRPMSATWFGLSRRPSSARAGSPCRHNSLANESAEVITCICPMLTCSSPPEGSLPVPSRRHHVDHDLVERLGFRPVTGRS